MAKRLMRLVVLTSLVTLVPVGVAHAGSASGNGSQVSQTKDVAFGPLVVPSCMQEEYVDLSGTLHVLLKEQSNNNKFSASFKFNVQSASGTGESTGDPYTAGASFSLSESGSYVNGVYSKAIKFNGTLTDLYTGLTDYITVNFKVQFNAQGIQTATVEVFDTNCII